MRSPGSPQSAFGLLGGPGFLLALMLVAALAGGIAYLAISGRLSVFGGASLTLPGADVPAAPAAIPDQPPPDSAADLKSMPAIPVPKEIALRVAIERDLSPGELLAKYPPDPDNRLSADSADLPAWQRFGRGSAISPEARRVALVVTGLGRDRVETVRAITGAPPEASLSFGADTADLADWIEAARAYGHEALLDVPLRSEDAPAVAGLALELAPAENLRRLDAMLESAPMIAGVAIAGGDSFLGDAAALEPILERLQTRGLAIVGLPVTAPLTIGADETIPAQATRKDIDKAMQSVTALARRRGVALAVVEASHAAYLFDGWYRATMERGEISLVPVSALVEK
ncbi:MAG: divergent polysaccharide deacetylase family protein [Dongiaceae bacterium]